MYKIIAFLAAMGAHDVPRQEINCIATAVYHESRGEGISGQMAVAHVIMNRVESNQYPNTPCNVVYQRKQFSHIERAKPNRDSEAWLEAVEQAAFAYAGYTDDPTKGSTMYHNPIKAPNPKWDFNKLAYIGDLNNHRFYKENY